MARGLLERLSDEQKKRIRELDKTVPECDGSPDYPSERMRKARDDQR